MEIQTDSTSAWCGRNSIFIFFRERPSMDLIGVVVSGMNNAHDISAGKEQKQILLSSPFSIRLFSHLPAYSYSLSMSARLAV